MPVVALPSALRGLAGHRAKLRVAGATVAQVLEALCVEAPGLREKLFTSDGALRRTIGVFRGDDDARDGALAVSPDETLTLVCAIAGG